MKLEIDSLNDFCQYLNYVYAYSSIAKLSIVDSKLLLQVIDTYRSCTSTHFIYSFQVSKEQEVIYLHLPTLLAFFKSIPTKPTSECQLIFETQLESSVKSPDRVIQTTFITEHKKTYTTIIRSSCLWHFFTNQHILPSSYPYCITIGIPIEFQGICRNFSFIGTHIKFEIHPQQKQFYIHTQGELGYGLMMIPIHDPIQLSVATSNKKKRTHASQRICCTLTQSCPDSFRSDLFSIQSLRMITKWIVNPDFIQIYLCLNKPMLLTTYYNSKLVSIHHLCCSKETRDNWPPLSKKQDEQLILDKSLVQNENS